MDQTKPTIADFNTLIKPTWCPGCGNFAILNALKMALVEKGLKPQDVLLCFDIGCNGNGADKIRSYGFKGLHGRVIPAAAGAKIANSSLPIIAIAGDGASLDEGMLHFMHAFRNNYDVVFLMHNNENFGLTTGQETPTTPKGQPMPVSPWGVVSERVNPMQLALSAGASFVASGWSGNQKHLKDMIVKAIDHKGFGYVNIYQHCPTYNDFEDQNWLKDKVYDVNQKEGYDNANRMKAYEEIDYSSGKRALGVIYQDPNSIPFSERIPYRKEFQTKLIDEVKKFDVTPLMERFK